jgi:hypothetical protein
MSAPLTRVQARRIDLAFAYLGAASLAQVALFEAIRAVARSSNPTAGIDTPAHLVILGALVLLMVVGYAGGITMGLGRAHYRPQRIAAVLACAMVVQAGLTTVLPGPLPSWPAMSHRALSWTDVIGAAAILALGVIWLRSPDRRMAR